MNTLLVISLAFGLALCQSSVDSFEAVYREGKEYVYDYESQVLTGLPKGSRIYSGIKIKAKVRFQFPSVTRVKCQFDDVLVFKVNDRIDTADPTRDMVPTELFKEIRDPDIDRMKTELFKPVSFSYIRGHVDDLVTEEDDPVWSVNIKRGILSFLELNFNERQSLQSFDNPVSVEHSDLKPKFYRVVEPSVTGECETSYWVRPDITHDGQPLMNIMKVRNFDRCMDRVFFIRDMFNSRHCDYCEPNMPFDPLTAQASVRYNIAGSPSQFIIINAVGESQYNFVPYLERGGRITSFTNQTLNLIDSRPISSQIPSPTSPQKHECAIKGDKPEPKKSTKPWSQKQSQQKDFEMRKNYQMALKILMTFEKNSREKIEEEIGDILIELRRVLRTLNRPFLEKLLVQVNKETFKHARKGLVDILPVLGSFDGVDIIIDRLMKEDPIINWPPSVFMTLALMPYPDVPIIQRIWEFVERKEFRDPVYKRVAWLSLGSLGFKMMKMNRTEEKEIQKKQKLIEELLQNSNVKEIRRQLQKKLQKMKEEHLQKVESYNTLRQNIVNSVLKHLKSSNPDDVILAIKTIGNLGYMEFFPEVRDIMVNREMPTITRMQAIFCMRRMHRYIPNKVRRVLLPVYLNWKENEEVRMAAFITFMDTNPPRPDLGIITRSILDEPSYNVGALVWANLIQLSNRTTSCECIQSLARNTTLALRYAKKYKWGLQYSNNLFMSSYNRNFKFGHSYEHALLFSSKERLPRGFAAVYNAAFLGQSAQMFEFGMSGKGLDSYLDQLSKDVGSTSLPDVLSSLLKPRKPRSTKQSEQEMDEIKQKLKMEPRVTDPTEGHIYFKLFDQELVYIDIPPPRMQEQDSSRQPSPIKPKNSYDTPISSMFGSFFDMMRMMKSVMFPLRYETVITETGLPMWLKLDLIGAMKIDTDFKLERSKSQKQSWSPKDMVLDIKPSGLFQFRCEMGIDMRYFWSGAIMKAGIHFNSPMLLSVNIDPDKSKMIIRLKEEQILNPVKFEMMPMTFIRHYPHEVSRYPVLPEVKEILVVDGVVLEPFRYEYGKDWFGRIIGITGHRPVPRIEDVPFFPMNGKWLVYTEYKPIHPTGLELQFQHVSETKGQIVSAEKTSSSESSSWWPFDWWSSSEQVHQNQQPATSYRYSQEGISQEQLSQESEDSDSGFIHLQEKDLTIEYLKKKFGKVTTVSTMANKCGFVLRLAEPGTNPIHEVMISTFYQRVTPGLEDRYTVELRRAPIPGLEDKHWKWVTDIKMTYPNFVMEPSDLFSDEYQQQLQKQIEISVRDDGKHKDTLLNFDTMTLTQAVKQFYRLTQPSTDINTIRGLINHLMEHSNDPNSEVLKEIIQKQRQLNKEVKELKKQPNDIKKRKQISNKYLELLEKSESVLRKVKDKLEDTLLGQQKPEDSVMIHSIFLKVQKTVKELGKTLWKVRLILPPHEQISYENKFDSLKEDLKTARQKQEQHSVSKQPQEIAKSHIEISPQQRSTYSLLLDPETQTFSTIQKMQQHQQDLESLKPEVEEIIMKSKKAKEELDHILITDCKLDKFLRVKALELILKQKLIAGDLEQKLKTHKYVNPANFNTRKEMKELQFKLKKIASEMLKRVAMAVNTDKEMSLTTSLPQAEQTMFKTLMANNVKQIQVFEQLQMLHKEPIDKQQVIRTLHKSMETVQEMHDSIKAIVQQKEQEKTVMNPVLIKTIKVLSKHAILVEKVRQILKQSKVHSLLTPEPIDNSAIYSPRAVNMDPNPFTPEDFKKKVDDFEKESIKLLKKLNTMLSPAKDSQLLTKQHYKPKDSARSLLEKVHKVQAKQLQQQSVVQSTIESLDQPTPEKSQMKHLFVMYKVLTDMSQLQKDQEKVQDELKMKYSESPSYMKFHSVCSQLKDSIVQQKEKVKMIEKKMMKKYSQDSSYRLVVQKIQQLKDHMKKLYQDQQIFEQKMDQNERQYQQPYPSRMDSYKYPQWYPQEHSSSKSSKVHGEIQGVVTMYYGLEGSKMNMLYVKIFGKKSIEQLLFEKKQSMIGEQDKLVQDYLEDMQQKNDKLTPSYHKLKNELNIFRYWRVLCAYDKESVAVEVRSLFWKTHEYLKYLYYPKSTLMMPDNTNVENNFELVTEMRRDMRSMDMELRTPYETTWFRNLHVPDMCAIFLTPNTETYFSHILKGLTKNKLPATCQVSSLRIKTLDQHRYEVPPFSMTCKKVLSMDCSPDSKYVVYSQPSKTDLSLKDITLLTKNEKIEIVQEHTGSIVKNKNQAVGLFSPVTIKNEDGSLVFVKKSDQKVTVSIPKLSLSVTTDGKTTEIMVDQYYWSKVCGLCGNLDSDPNNDLEGPQKVMYPDGPTMSAAYLVPDENCNAEQIQLQMGIPDLRKNSKMTHPVQQTKIMEKRQGRVHKTCFSTMPVKRCPERTTPEGTTSRLVSYHCLDSASPVTQKLITRSHTHILNELKYKTVDLNAYESEPKACITK